MFPSKLPQTQMEWAQLLEAQQRYHDVELQKWREIIKSSVVLLDQVQPRTCYKPVVTSKNDLQSGDRLL